MKPIRASDIGTYLYCHRAWYYRQHGQESINQAELSAGTELHRAHGRKVILSGLYRTAGLLLLFAALVLVTGYLTITYLK